MCLDLSTVDALQAAFNQANVALLSALKNNEATSPADNVTESKMDEDESTAEPALIDSLAASGYAQGSEGSESVDMEPIPYAEV